MARTATKSNEDAKNAVSEALTQLENGISALTSSDMWKKYLSIQSKFHNYSFGNTMLIMLQCPHATRVAGYQTWLKLKRQVRKGEKGIKILAPRIFEKVETDESGNEVKRKGIYFVVVSVFDISQTDGEDLAIPNVVTILQGDDMAHLLDRLVNFSVSVNNCPVTFEEYDDSSNGYYDPGFHKIVVKSSLPINQQVKTAIHEIAHSMLHRNDEVVLSKEERELEAESVAYIVCNALGYDTSDYSFGYLAGWATGTEGFVKTMKRLGERVQRASQAILDGISDKHSNEVKEIA